MKHKNTIGKFYTMISMKEGIIGLFVIGFIMAGCRGTTLLDESRLEIPMNKTQTVDHTLFDALLKKHVNEAGLVDYSSVKAGTELDAYLDVLAAVSPGELDEQEAIAFWINAYNAYTIKLIVENYPVGSIREISPFRIKGLRLAVPKINSPFEYTIAVLDGKKYSLDDIEHGILRKEFNEPRIHFALVCAAISCPPLRREAFTGEGLDAQLDDQARAFLYDETKNIIGSGDTIHLSKIFDWFRGDFADSKSGLQQYLAPYFEGATREKLSQGGFKVKHLGYDWTLNEDKEV